MVRRTGQKSVTKAFLSSPLVMVLSVAMLVVFAMSLAGYFRRGGFWSPEVEARVYNERRRAGANGTDGLKNGQRTFAFQGEVYEEAEQVREASSLLMVTTLLAIDRTFAKKPFSTVEELLRGVAEGGLLPPGSSCDGGNRSVTSPHADFYIRYRPEPLGVEVLSIGKARQGAVAILVRMPDDEVFENRLTYYVMAKANTSAPSPFLPAAQLMGAGWKPESFKALEMSPSDREKQREWLAARTSGAVR